MNRKIEKRIRKKRQEKKIMFEHFNTYRVTFGAAFCLCVRN